MNKDKKILMVLGGCLLTGFVCAAIVFAAIGFFLVSTPSMDGGFGDTKQADYLDQPAPLFTTTTLDGTSWSLEDQRGKVILIDFWASWCGPCIQAMPHLRKIHTKYGDREDFVMIGVSVDDYRGNLLRSIDKHDVTWEQLFEEGMGWENSVARLYEVDGIPHVLIVDQEGVIRAYDPAGRQIDRALEELLGV